MNQINNEYNKFIKRSTNKGTNFITEEEQSKSHWCGTEFATQEIERLRLAGDMMIMSAKGTKSIDLKKMQAVKRTPIPEGYRISSAKGTGSIYL